MYSTPLIVKDILKSLCSADTYGLSEGENFLRKWVFLFVLYLIWFPAGSTQANDITMANISLNTANGGTPDLTEINISWNNTWRHPFSAGINSWDADRVDMPFAQRSNTSVSAAECGELPHLYTVKSGDMLSKIGNEFGSALFWEAIYIANADLIDNPDLIYVGQQLEIPRNIADLSESDKPVFDVVDDPFCDITDLPLHAVDTTRIYLYDIEELRSRSQKIAEQTETDDTEEETEDAELETFRQAFESVAGNSEENRNGTTRRQEEAQQQSERQIMMEIDGMILDETRSKVGRDFYDVFYSNWQSPPDAYNFSISISEQPSPSLGTIIYVEVNEDETFRMRLQPRYDFIQQAGQYAVRQTYSYLQNNDYQLQIY